MLLYVSLFFFVSPPRGSIFEPRVSCDGGFAAVPVVVEQLLALVDVSRGDEDEVRDPVDVVEFGLAVSVFTVIYQPTHSTSLFCGVHAVSFAEELEVVHVAASGRVLSVFSLPLLGVGDLQQVSVVLHHVLAFLETPSGEHRSPLSFYVLHLHSFFYSICDEIIDELLFFTLQLCFTFSRAPSYRIVVSNFPVLRVFPACNSSRGLLSFDLEAHSSPLDAVESAAVVAGVEGSVCQAVTQRQGELGGGTKAGLSAVELRRRRLFI